MHICACLLTKLAALPGPVQSLPSKLGLHLVLLRLLLGVHSCNEQPLLRRLFDLGRLSCCEVVLAVDLRELAREEFRVVVLFWLVVMGGLVSVVGGVVVVIRLMVVMMMMMMMGREELSCVGARYGRSD